jgi:hypothetical protein
MKYIFVAGAPGSKWSSVCKNIYFSPDIDSSDARPHWEYWHDAPGQLELMHMGAYFDPGMESDLSDNISLFGRENLEAMFDAPFQKSNNGIRIIKSHIFCNHIPFLRQTWPDCPVVMVYRPDDACLGWWVKCGHFDITYPLYHKYYVDLRTMAKRIAEQNSNLRANDEFARKFGIVDNIELCQELGIAKPGPEYRQNYNLSDISVRILL